MPSDDLKTFSPYDSGDDFTDSELDRLLSEEFKQLKQSIVTNPLCDLRQPDRKERLSIGKRP